MTYQFAPEQFVDLELIEEPRHLARAVNKAGAKYMDLLADMRAHGQRDAVEVTGPAEGPYVLTDGMHRFSGAHDLKWQQLRVKRRIDDGAEAMTDSERLFQSLKANTHRVEQTPAATARALRVLLNADPGLTQADLARRMGKQPQWVRETLKLAALPEDSPAAGLLDSGAVSVSVGVELAKLHKAGGEITPDLLERAQVQPAAEIVPEVVELTKAARGLKAAKARTLPKLRKLSDVTAEWERSKAQETPCHTAALAWALQQDAASLMACGDLSACPLFAEPEPETVPATLWQVALAAAPPADLRLWFPEHADAINAAEAAFREAIEADAVRGAFDAKTRSRWRNGQRRPDVATRLRLLRLAD